MIRVAIVDDDQAIQSKLQQYIQTFERQSKEKFKITVYNDASELIKNYKSQYDIIYVSNISGYAIQGYKVGALSYII